MEHSVTSSSVAPLAQSPYSLLKDRMAGYEGRFLAIVLAGGRGERLRSLTNHRAQCPHPEQSLRRRIGHSGRGDNQERSKNPQGHHRIDHGNIIYAGQEIGYNLREDARRYHLDDSGIVVIPHRYMIK